MVQTSHLITVSTSRLCDHVSDWLRHLLQTSDDEDWRHKIKDVRSLLDRLKEERRAELNQQVMVRI